MEIELSDKTLSDLTYWKKSAEVEERITLLLESIKTLSTELGSLGFQNMNLRNFGQEELIRVTELSKKFVKAYFILIQ